MSKRGWDTDYDFRELRDGRAHFFANRKPKRGELLMPSFGVDCRFGVVGDRLWCRETWAPRGVHVSPGGATLQTLIAFRADIEPSFHLFPYHEIAREPHDWKPSIFMPRWASRITLEIVEVRVERLNAISPDDCRAEGMPKDNTDTGVRYCYGQLWNQLNEARGYGWNANPWVFVIEFKRITP